MPIRRVTCGIAIAAILVGACGSTASPSPSTPSNANEIALVARIADIAPAPSATPTPWRTYVSDVFRYEISVPSTWAVTAGGGPFADEIDDRDLPWLFVRRGLADGSPATVSAAVSGDILIERRDDHAQLVSARGVTLAGGYEGTYLLYHGRIALGPVTVQRVIVAKASVFYYFTLYGQPWAETPDTALFQQIYESWKPT